MADAANYESTIWHNGKSNIFTKVTVRAFRGIKLINFALGPTPSDQRNVYLLDFSMVRRFKVPPDNKVRPARRYAVYRGALTYASPNNLMHRDAGRCDDLCSWFYCLAEMAGGDLPWETTGYDIGYKTSSISLSKMTKLEKLAKQKLDSRQELLKNLPVELATVYAKIFSLQYDDQPDYILYKSVIAKLCQSMSISEVTPYDWELDGLFHNELAFVNYPMMLMPLNVSSGAEDERTKYERISHGEKAAAPPAVDAGVGRTPGTMKRFSSLDGSSLNRSDASFGEPSQK